MKVYIEIVIIINFVATMVVCSVTARILSITFSVRKKIICSTVGTVLAVVMPLIPLGVVTQILFNVAVGIICGGILCVKKRKKMRIIVTFFLITALIGGVIFGLHCMLGIEYSSVFILIIIFAIYALTRIFIKLIIRKKSAFGLNRKVKLCFRDNEYELIGFVDTGNSLIDSMSKLPVVVLSLGATIRLLSDSELTSVMLGTADKIIEGGRYLQYSTVSNKNSQILLVKPQKFLLYFESGANKIYEVMIGLSTRNLGEYDSLLPTTML